jgi:hypothetical protein
LLVSNPDRTESNAERISSLADPLLHNAIGFGFNASEVYGV